MPDLTADDVIDPLAEEPEDEDGSVRSVLDEALGPQLVDALAAASRRYDVMITISVAPYDQNRTADRDSDDA